jgi:anti-sigma regulatory factor (Ser/Thr protein kinase)
VVRVKRVPDIESALSLVSEMADACKPINVDFTDIGFVSPSAALLISSVMRRTQVEARINEDATGFGYAAHIGFFDACGVSGIGNKVGEASGSPGYSPIKCLEFEDVKRQSRQQGSAVPEVLQTRGENLARILTRGSDPKIMRVVTYAMREILRNCVEHSTSSTLWYAGQYWENSHTVEVAVLDEGVGMLASLRHNPENADISCEEEAIRAALLPAVSGVPLEQRKGDWGNSGYGLYITRRMCGIGSGSFGVVSNDAALLLSEKGDTKIPSMFRGTLVVMRLDTSRLDGLDGDFAERIAREGEIEYEMRTGKKSPASSTSRSVEI